MPITDLVREYLQIEKNTDLPAEERVQKLLELITKIEELRPMLDPMLVIGRYRPSLGPIV
jgi:hypothetical protein